MEISVSFGIFQLSDNGKGGSIISTIKGKKLAEYPSIPSWNLDAILERVNAEQKMIEGKLAEEQKSMELNDIEVLGMLETCRDYICDRKEFKEIGKKLIDIVSEFCIKVA